MIDTDRWKNALFLGILLVFAIALPVFALSNNGTNSLLCSALDSERNSVNTQDNQFGVSDTGNRNQELSCSGELPEAAIHPSEVVTWDHTNTGYVCRAQSVSTDRWDETTTPEGTVTLSCHFDSSSLPNPGSLSSVQITPF